MTNEITLNYTLEQIQETIGELKQLNTVRANRYKSSILYLSERINVPTISMDPKHVQMLNTSIKEAIEYIDRVWKLEGNGLTFGDYAEKVHDYLKGNQRLMVNSTTYYRFQRKLRDVLRDDHSQHPKVLFARLRRLKTDIKKATSKNRKLQWANNNGRLLVSSIRWTNEQLSDFIYSLKSADNTKVSDRLLSMSEALNVVPSITNLSHKMELLKFLALYGKEINKISTELLEQLQGTTINPSMDKE